MAKLNTIPLTDQIADYVREQIFEETFQPGQRINEQAIAEAAGTSRGPVRDALMLLEQEGLVQRIPRRGTFVVELTKEDVYEIYTLRTAIEQFAVRLIVSDGRTRALDSTARILNEMIQSTAGGETTRRDMTTLDMQFHRELVLCAGHSRALAAWDGLAAQSTMLNFQGRQVSRLSEQDITADHQAIYDALIQADAVLACELLAKHFAKASFFINAVIDSGSDPLPSD